MKSSFNIAYGVFLFFSLMACTPFVGFKPAPEWWTYFKGNGFSEKDIRLALLECGSSTPGYYTEFIIPSGEQFPETDLNEAVVVTKCMEISGFPDSDRFDLCAGGGTDMYGNRVSPPNVPACKPDFLIPTRSIKTRLNSPYCKIYPKVPICQPDYDPSTVEVKPSPKPKALSITPAPSADPAMRLQEQVQKQSNAQMNKMLQGVRNRQ